MTRRFTRTAAALFCAVASSAVVPAAFANPAALPADRPAPQNANHPASEQLDEAAVKELLSKAFSDAVSRRDINGVLDQISKSDRERLGQSMPREVVERFKGNAEMFDKVWTEKYGHAFQITDAREIYENVKVEVKEKGADGRKLAVVTMPELKDKTGYILHLTRSDDGPWRLMLPESMTSESLGSNLAGAMRTLATEDLPRRENDAFSHALTRFYRTCSYGMTKAAEEPKR